MSYNNRHQIAEQPGLGVGWPLTAARAAAPLVLPDGTVRPLALWAQDTAGNPVGVQKPDGTIDGATVTVAASRALTAADNGMVLECTTGGLTLTVPAGLPANFDCVVLTSGTTTFASSGGTLLNGATTSVTRDATLNPAVGIIARTASNSYVVTGS